MVGDDRATLYDLTADPGETDDLSATAAARASAMASVASAFAAAHPAVESRLLDERAHLDALRALGYLE